MIHQDDAIRPPVFPLEIDSGGGPAVEASGVGVDGSEKQLVEDLIDESSVDEVQAHKSLPTPVLPSLTDRAYGTSDNPPSLSLLVPGMR